MALRDKLRTIIDDNRHGFGKFFALFIQLLIIVSLISFSLETLPNLQASEREILTHIEWITITVFTVEYLLRLWIAEKRLKFVFSFFGLVDLLAILPFFVASGMDLRAVRAIRLMRLFRILKLVKYSSAIRRFHRALIIAREELILFGFVSMLVLYLSAVGIYYFENPAQPDQFRSVVHCLWWAVTTLTTVGYGDMVPLTNGGRFFTFVVLAVGLGIVAVPTGLVASALSQARSEELEQLKRQGQQQFDDTESN